MHFMTEQSFGLHLVHNIYHKETLLGLALVIPLVLHDCTNE